MASIKLDGRLLFLSCDPALVKQQLNGGDINLAQALPLRDDVSTDEMTPQTVCTLFDERIGTGLLVAFKAGDEVPIPHNAIKDGGFSVVVGGKRYGKGSSREHSPLAHISAGIRLIVAESFERIFRQNCDNLGIFTSTDFGLIDRIRAGEHFELAELAKERDDLAQQLLASGGLLQYAQNHNISKPMPKTLTEKIIERHAVDQTHALKIGQSGFIKTDWRFSHDYYTGMIGHLLRNNLGENFPLHDKSTILLFEDHLTYAHRSPVHKKNGIVEGAWNLGVEHRRFAEQYGVKDHGRVEGMEGSEGICHAMMAEDYALPGQVVVGTDSHTTHSGALGCFAFGVGSTDMASAFSTGVIRLTIPESIKIDLQGVLPDGLTAKDIVLHLLAMPELKKGAGLGKVFEFTGNVTKAMSIDERTTLTNMVAELGGFTGIVAPDEDTVAFLKERRGITIELEDWMRSDEGALYSAVIEVNCSSLSTMVALPGDPGNGVPLSSILNHVAIDIAYGGSCTAGKREDFDEYFNVLSWADKNNLGLSPGVSLFLQFGTLAVKKYCEEKGYVALFEKFGVELLLPGCGACAGGGPGSSERPEQTTVSAINRNFPLRSGPGKVWLSSPATAVASAVAGRLMSFADLKANYPNVERGN